MPELRQKDVQDHLKKLCDAAGGLRAWAEKKKVSHSYVAQVLRGDRPPSEGMCRAMGIKEDGMRWVLANGKAKK